MRDTQSDAALLYNDKYGEAIVPARSGPFV